MQILVSWKMYAVQNTPWSSFCCSPHYKPFSIQIIIVNSHCLVQINFTLKKSYLQSSKGTDKRQELGENHNEIWQNDVSI